jgi:hypothetical protein
MAHERVLAEEAARQDAERRRQAREARLGVAANMMSAAYREFMQLAQAGRLTPYACIQALQLAMDCQRRDLGEADQCVELSGPGGSAEALTIRVIYQDSDRPEGLTESAGSDGGGDRERPRLWPVASSQ